MGAVLGMALGIDMLKESKFEIQDVAADIRSI